MTAHWLLLVVSVFELVAAVAVVAAGVQQRRLRRELAREVAEAQHRRVFSRPPERARAVVEAARAVASCPVAPTSKIFAVDGHHMRVLYDALAAYDDPRPRVRPRVN